MKAFSSYLLLIFLFACSSTYYPSKEQFASVTIDELKANLSYLSSDEMKGRDTGSDELKKAARFLSDKLKSYGYKGLADEGSFLQKLYLYTTAYKFESMKMRLGDQEIPLKQGENIVLYARSKPSFHFESKFYYVQDGIYTDSIKQFDKNLAKDAIILRTMLSDSEKEMGFSDRILTRKLMADFKAKMVISISGEANAEWFDRLNAFASRSGRTIDLKKVGQIQALLKEKTSRALFKVEGIKNFDYTKAYEFKKKITFSIENEVLEKKETQNVVGLLEGSDANLKSELIAYGAHYDHLGVGKDGQIYNGADDDGSGTVSTLQIAKAISLKAPKRSVMIIFHTGEEKGLLGSSYFSDHPLVDLKKMVAMFNMDMVGRSKSDRDTLMHPNAPITERDEIYLVGADRISQQLHDISEETNKNLDKLWGSKGKVMRLNYLLNDENHPERIYYRSDHWNYAKKGVPIIFYFDGIHVDYHKPTDTVEKIDFEKLQNVTILALATGYRVANLEKRLKLK